MVAKYIVTEYTGMKLPICADTAIARLIAHKHAGCQIDNIPHALVITNKDISCI